MSTNAQATSYMVGTPISGVIEPQPFNGLECNHLQSGLTVKLCLPDLSKTEIEAFRKSPVYMTILPAMPLVMFTFRIDGIIGLTEAMFSLARVPPEYRFKPTPFDDPKTGMAMTMLLIEQNTGVVHGIRLLSLPHHATNVLIGALREQFEHSLDPSQGDARYQQILREYPTVEALDRAAQVRFTAGRA